MRKLLVYPDVPHFRSVAHLKLGKIFSLAIFLMVLFGSGQQAKSEVKLTKVWDLHSLGFTPDNVNFSDDDSLCCIMSGRTESKTSITGCTKNKYFNL
jgi:hypothetical protein